MSVFRRIGSEDDGSVMIAVVGIMIVLTVLAIGAFSMADNNLFQSKRDRRSAQALSVAESGLDQVLWRIRIGKPPNSGVPISIPVTDTVMSTIGTCVVTPVQNGAAWHVVAVGSAVGTPTVTRTLSVDAISISIYDMFYADGPLGAGSNGHINGNGTFHGSAYMRGNWPPTNGNAYFLDGPFFVKDGNIQLGGSAIIGQPPPSRPVDVYCNGTVDFTGNYMTLHTSVPDLPMPQQSGTDLATKRTTANNESRDGLQGTPNMGGNLANDEADPRRSTPGTGVPCPLAPPYTDKAYAGPAANSPDRNYKVIDDNGTNDSGGGNIAAFDIDRSAAGAVLPSFGRPYDPTLGHSPDDFAWDAATGVLTVQGTVYIDAASVYIKDVKWAGKGTLVCSGSVIISGTYEPACFTLPVAGSTHPDPGDDLGYPKANCLGISASGLIHEYSPNGYGVFYSSISWDMDPAANGHQFHGEIVAPDITLGKHSDVWCTPNMGANLPAGMPGGGGQIVSVAGWHEGRN